MTAIYRKQHSLQGLLAVAGMGLLAAGCSIHTPFVDYSERGVYASDNTGNIPYVEVGPITGSAHGFVWDSCDDLINQALDEAQAKAEEHAANAMIGVRWRNHAEGTWHDSPRCTSRWGWFALGGVGGLHPWVKVAQFEGRLVFADGDELDKVRGSKVDFREGLAAARQAELQRRMEERRKQEQAAKAKAEAAEDNE